MTQGGGAGGLDGESSVAVVTAAAFVFLRLYFYGFVAMVFSKPYV